MYRNKKIGNFGERVAEEYLIKNNYKILEKNYRERNCEIDIISSYKNEIIFVEVKTRTNFKYGRGIEAVDYKKQMHIKKASKYYLYINNISKMNIRYDVIEILLKNDVYKINHITNAF